MTAQGRKTKRITLFVGFLLTAFLSATPLCIADGHKETGKHYDHWWDRKGGGGFGKFFDRGHDEGNETTGQIVAWSLAAANLTVALSLIVRGVKQFVPVSPELKNALARFNNNQKKYLMRFHYTLNPMILAMAGLHWTLSRCRSTALPEWGLLMMALIVALGVVLKFKLCPKTLLRRVYRIHTQPALLLLLISFLVIGHLTMD